MLIAGPTVREVRMDRSRRQAGRQSNGRQNNGVGDSPTAVRMLIGVQLRRLREERGFSRVEAGDRIRSSESKISRMELGRVRLKMRDVADLLTLYGVDEGTEREALLERVREANVPGWWQPYNDVTPDWFSRYLGLEATATLIRTYETQFVPGLLQTPDYARAVVRLGHVSASDEEIRRRVQLRLERQQAVLHRPDPPRLWAVVDEAALHRPVGGRAVMRDQLEALIAIVTKAPGVRLQVLPLAAGGHAAAGGAFTMLRFGQQRPHLTDLVYVEQLTHALYLEHRADVEVYFDAVNRLYLEAAPIDKTVELLDRILDERYRVDG
jgi:transcriptional regulator with XRE-family HTH domain